MLSPEDETSLRQHFSLIQSSFEKSILSAADPNLHYLAPKADFRRLRLLPPPSGYDRFSRRFFIQDAGEDCSWLESYILVVCM